MAVAAGLDGLAAEGGMSGELAPLLVILREAKDLCTLTPAMQRSRFAQGDNTPLL